HPTRTLFPYTTIFRSNDILKIAKSEKIVVQTVTKSKIDYLTDGPHQGIAAQIAPYPYKELEDFISETKDIEHQPCLLMLDGLEDPHNLGSIMRTADAIGIDGIIIPK